MSVKKRGKKVKILVEVLASSQLVAVVSVSGGVEGIQISSVSSSITTHQK